MSTDRELQIAIKTTADVAGAKAAEQAVRGVGAAAGATGKAAAGASKDVRRMGLDFTEGAAAGRVLGEAARGNVAAFGQLGYAIRVVGTLLRTSFIGVLVTLGAVAASVLIPLLKGFQSVKDKTEDATKAAEEHKKKLQEVEAVAKKSLEAQVGEVSALASAYTALIGLMDAASNRADRMFGLQKNLELSQIALAEQQALARAATPEEASAISARFAGEREGVEFRGQEGALINRELRARIELRNAESAMSSQSGQRYAAQTAAARARTSRDTTAEFARQAAAKAAAEPGEGSEAILRAAKADLSAEDKRLAAAEMALARITTDTAAAIEAAAQRINAAKDTVAEVAIERETLQTNLAAGDLQRALGAKPRMADLSATAADAASRGDYGTQDNAVAELREMRAATERRTPELLKAATNAVQAQAQQSEVVIKAINGVAVNAKKTERQLLNGREQ